MFAACAPSEEGREMAQQGPEQSPPESLAFYFLGHRLPVSRQQGSGEAVEWGRLDEVLLVGMPLARGGEPHWWPETL